MPRDPRDPRNIITPDAFTVDPQLLGIALATPWQRLAAMLIDLILAAILANSGFTLLFLAFVALLGWRVIGGPAERFLAGRGRGFFRVAGAVLAIIVFLNIRGEIRDRQREEPEDEPVELTTEQEQVTENLDFSIGEGIEFGQHMAALHSGSSSERSSAAASFGEWVAGLDRPEEKLEAAIPALAALVPAALHTAYYEGADYELPADTAATVPDSVLLAYAAARAAGDTVRVQALQAQVVAVVAGDSLARLTSSVQALDQANDQLENELEELRDRDEGGGFLTSAIRNIMDDLGIGLGWAAFYFTVFVVLGTGQTPGKKLLKIRVLRLDNRPLGWWLAFERFGGYGACLATGLLGFAQILWDRNRQGLHDKATETVVVKLRAGQPVRLDPSYRASS